MIIGISGKMGSGKDTVGQIIHQLMSVHKDSVHNTSVDYSLLDNGWETKKYADKLKDIVCMLIGCTREQLEDRDFKESELGTEWNKLVDHIDAQAEAMLGDGRCQKVVKMTPRKMLQLLGTEAGREIIHPNIWVNSLFADYKPLNIEARASMGNVVDYSNCEFPKWIVTDMRFPNELQAIKRRGGLTIRVNRPSTDKSAGNHPSETALDNAEFDYVIENTGSITDLMLAVKQILKLKRII